MQELEKHALSLYLSADFFVKTADPSNVLFLRPNHRATMETFFSFYTNVLTAIHMLLFFYCANNITRTTDDTDDRNNGEILKGWHTVSSL